MTSNLPYSCSSAPITEGWLLKALRLAHSKKPEDLDKLRKFYKDACEDEAKVARISTADALREMLEPHSSDVSEREVAHSSSRIRPVLVVKDPHRSSSPTPTTQSSPRISTSSPIALSSKSSSSSGKRTKVAFFNIFDPVTCAPASTTLRISTAASTMAQSNSTPTDTQPVVVDLTNESPTSDPPGCVTSSPTTVLSWSTDPTNMNAKTIPPPVLDLSSTPESTAPDAHLVASLMADLACSVCGKLTRPPQLEADGQTMNANMLVECVQCGALYHQMCHQPPVSSAHPMNQQDWSCSKCQPAVEPSPTTESTVVSGARKRKGGGSGDTAKKL